jgi:hypothetical protein
MRLALIQYSGKLLIFLKIYQLMQKSPEAGMMSGEFDAILKRE